MSAKHRPTPVPWELPPAPVPRPKVPRPTCRRCLSGDCHLCVRVGCFHPHGPEVRSHGLSTDHREPSPSGSDGENYRTEIDR